MPDNGMSVHQLAEAAAACWEARVLRLITQRENAVFEVALPRGGGRAALRLHRIGYQSAAAIRSELWWCAALADEGLAVPRALPARDGNALVALPGGRLASVITWAEGRPLGAAGEPFEAPLSVIVEQHHMLGRLLSAVHRATDALTLPADFVRPRWDVAGLVGEAPVWGRFWEHPAATPAQAARLRQIRAFLAEQLAAAAGAADFGPIHADVLRENVIVNRRSLSLIDFDDCGIGFRLYDLATALLLNLREPHYPDIRDALLQGYGKTGPAAAELVEVLVLARCCASVGWTAPRLGPGDPIHQSHIARALAWAAHLKV